MLGWRNAFKKKIIHVFVVIQILQIKPQQMWKGQTGRGNAPAVKRIQGDFWHRRARGEAKP